MNTVPEIMSELESLGSTNIKAILLKHGVKEPFFGVKIGDLKPIEKRIKRDYQLAKDLYATGNADAMYLAGLIADDAKMNKADLQAWNDAYATNSARLLEHRQYASPVVVSCCVSQLPAVPCSVSTGRPITAPS